MFNPVPVGKRTRYSYARIKDVMKMPHLLDIQRNSYQWFLDTGLQEIFNDISPIQDFSGNLVLSFESFSLGEPKYDLDECKQRDVTLAAPIRVNVRLINRETGEIKEQEVFMGDFPLMTDTGTFIINGAERVIVSQLVRSPGAYYDDEIDPTGKHLYSSTVIPNRGAWIELETDTNDVVSVRIDRTRKMPVTYFIRALGYDTDEEILDLFGGDPRILNTLDPSVDKVKTHREAVIEIYHRLRPGEPANEDNAQQLLDSLFFDPKRYDLATVGRYKLTKKLGWKRRILGKVLADPIVNRETGEIVIPQGEVVTEDMLDRVKPEDETALFGEGIITVYVLRKDGSRTKMLCSRTRDIYDRTITKEDIIASIDYLLNLMDGIGSKDDIDHLGNRRVRAVGELLQNQFRIGLSRMERVVRERMTIQDVDVITPQALINIRPVVAAIKEFFGSSQLSQFMDQHNPLSELTHKRRLSALGPGGLSRERAGFEVRDVHNSHYGRMCPVESPEGPNIGLIGSLATFARINQFGFMETPYRRVDKATHKVTDEVRYMTADEEDELVIAQANEPLDDNDWFVNERVTARYNEETGLHNRDSVDYMDVSPRQVFSIATAMIPFLENDDANRALMGANMQRQGVPLLRTQAPLVGTGMEYKAACDSGVMILAKRSGTIETVTADYIDVRTENGELDHYKLQKFQRSNQSTCINQVPIVYKGDVVEENQPIADGPATDHGELALGYNIVVAYMPWEGYNYEDAVLLSEDLVKRDLYTSIHIEEYECDARDTKLGPEEITRDIPNVAEDAIKDLDEDGIISIGADVRPGDILVGKVTPKGETELTAEERLLRAIFGEKAREVRDTSLRVPHGEMGKIVDVKIFSRDNNDELPPGVNHLVRIYIAQKRKISVGDKMAGRHGNKGVVSRILREEDMPFLPDGTPLQIVLNPLGVPSRMNLGQVLEVHLGLACRALGWHIATPVFDGATYEEILEHLVKAEEKMAAPEDENDPHVNEYHFHNGKPLRLDLDEEGKALFRQGKIRVRDGRTGDYFENPVTVGIMYFLKLHHLVDDKMHARSTGPYSLVTQQPLGGKAQFGGQRFGEMEVWALEAYGAANTLQEILTVKSDDTVGRVKTYEAIIKGQNIPNPGVPESFKVLLKEMQALSLDIRVLDAARNEIEIPELDPEDMPQSDALRASIAAKPEGEGEAAAEENEDVEAAAEEAFSMSEDDLSFGTEDEAEDSDDDFTVSEANTEDLEDFSVEDLSDLDLDDDI